MSAAAQEILFQENSLLDCDVLCVYGYEQVDQICSLYERLENQYLIVFLQGEDYFLPLGEKMRIVRLVNGRLCEQQFASYCWEFVFLRFGYFLAPQHTKEQRQDADYLFRQCKQIEDHIHLLASEYSDFGIKVWRNVCTNLRLASSYADFSSLQGAFRDIPAIICGAGPSLDGAIDFLSKHPSHALIFSGGAALYALSHQNITPHIAANIDPDPHYARFLEQTAFEVPFFYQDRISPQTVSQAHGKLVQAPSGGGWEIEEWLKNSLGIEIDPFDAGWTVATFSVALAGYFGCNPIIFAGLDFSYDPKTVKYALGIREDKEEPVMEIEDKEKGKLYSKRDWVMAARWVEEYAALHPEISFYNTSQSGMTLAGIPRVAFSDIAFASSYDLIGKIHHCFTELSYTPINTEMKTEAFHKLQNSLKMTMSCLDTLLQVYKKYHPEDPTEKGEYILAQHDLYEEIVYQKLLEPLWYIWRFPIERDVTSSYEKGIHQLLFFKKIIQAYLEQKCV